MKKSIGVNIFSLCPGILAVRTNCPTIRGWVFGVPNPLNQSTEPHKLTFDFILTKTINRKELRPIYGLFQGREGIDEIYFRRSLFKFWEPSLLVKDFLSANPKIFVNRDLLFLSKLRYSKTIPPIKYFVALALAKLVENGFLPLHAAGVERSGEAFIIFAPSNTGKTQTVLRLIKNKDLKLLGEDILITDGQMIYACPYTNTLEVKRSFPDNVKSWLLSRVFTPTPKTKLLVSQISSEQIGTQARIRYIFFLRKGHSSAVETIKPEALLSLLFNHNVLEFNRHWANMILTTCWLLTRWPNFYYLRQKEENILRKLSENTENAYLISGLGPEDYAEIICKMLKR